MQGRPLVAHFDFLRQDGFFFRCDHGNLGDFLQIFFYRLGITVSNLRSDFKLPHCVSSIIKLTVSRLILLEFAAKEDIEFIPELPTKVIREFLFS